MDPDTTILHAALERRRGEAEYAAQLLKECDKLELDLAVLKAKRSGEDVRSSLPPFTIYGTASDDEICARDNRG